MATLVTQMSIHIDGRGCRIQAKCDTSRVTFFSIEIPPDVFCQLVGRLSEVPVLAEVNNLDKVGKRMENKKFSFPMPKSTNRYLTYEERDKIAVATAAKLCPDGWEPDNYFGSQDSYYTHGEKQMAQTTIRRWV